MNKNEAAKDKLTQTEKCFEEDCRIAKTAYEKRLIDRVANSGSRDLAIQVHCVLERRRSDPKDSLLEF